MLKVKLFDIPGLNIILKLKHLAKDNVAVSINMTDYLKFCFDAEDFIAASNLQLANFGCYGFVDGMKIFVTKVDEGFVLLESKCIN